MSEKRRLNATREDINAIKEWLKKQPHLPDEIDELVIERFLYCCAHSLHVTKSTMDLFFTLRFQAPEIFTNRDPLSPEIQQTYSVIDFLPLPNRTKENYQVFLYRLRDHDAENYNFNNATKLFFMVADLRITFDEPLTEGEIPIYDMNGGSLKHLTKIVFSTLKKYMEYTQEAHPVRLRHVHMINMMPFFDKIFSMIKPLVKSEVLELFHFHQPGSDTLYKYVPRELLPDEYGGSAGSIDAIKESWIKRLEKHRNYFLDEKKWIVDESRRPLENKTKSSKNMEGSFRSLAID